MQDSFFQKIFLLKISFKKVEETGCSPVWAAAHLFRLPTTQVATICSTTRVAEVVRGNGGPPPKSLDSDENFKPEHTLFCRELRFVAIYAHFGDLWAKNVPFWFKNSVSWARSALLHGIYCIFY